MFTTIWGIKNFIRMNSTIKPNNDILDALCTGWPKKQATIKEHHQIALKTVGAARLFTNLGTIF